MGVPVLTLSGRCFASRVCGSLVRSAGIPELVCNSPEHFVARAIALATTDRMTLTSYRQRLIDGRDSCTLFDIDLLARKIEGLYAEIAAAHRAGATPQPDLTNLESYLAIGAAFDHDGIEIGQSSDYHAIYRAALNAQHRRRPLIADERFWQGAEAPRAAQTRAA
jgi:hypothetical protein